MSTFSIPHPSGALHDIKYPNFEGQMVEEKLYPPEIDVIRQALSLLVDSTQRVNQTRHLSTNALAASPQQRADRYLSEVIKVACQALIREADTQSNSARRRYDTQSNSARRRYDTNIDAFRRYCAIEAAKLAYRENSLAPINKLPFEVLSHILTFVPNNGWGNFSHTQVIRTLTIVGKHWMQVVFSTPQLWSTLEENMSPKQLGLAMRRSKTTSLHIYFETFPYSISRKKREMFVKAIMPHIRRWKTLEGDNVSDEVLDRVESNVSSLQILRLKTNYTANTGSSPGLGNGAQLQHLELANIGTTWTSTRLHGLKHLQLSMIKPYHALSFVSFFQILEHSPQLEVLLLDGVLFTDMSLPIPKSLPSFMSLRRLQMVRISRIAYCCILRRLYFPKCKSIELATYMAGQTNYRHGTPIFAKKIRSALLRHQDGPSEVVLRHVINHQGSKLIITQRRCDRMVSDKPGFSLQLVALPDTDEAGSLNAVQQVVELVRQARRLKSPIHLEILVGEAYPVEHLNRFDDTNLVEKISFLEGSNVQTVLRYLVRRREYPGPGAAPTWLFPRLKAISIPGLKTLDLPRLGSANVTSTTIIRDWVKERWVECTDSESGTRPEGCVEVLRPGGIKELWKPAPTTRYGRRVAPTPWVPEVQDDDDDDEYNDDD
ncbi:hypothetical protein FRB93_007381 [Tulasnella sp. JGI-2019a]|nr:hypothetical protein FRB93_007381 [Tulasnella sp. JGI-2019a]